MTFLPLSTFLAAFYTRNPLSLLSLGLVCTVLGIRLLIKGRQGDTLMPGTNFTYLPVWLFYVSGILMQLPLPLAWWFLRAQGVL
jgi:hypothetical protein